MTFKEWYKTNRAKIISSDAYYDITKLAWNAAIDAADTAIDSSDYSDCDAGHGANCNAMVAVEKLKAI